MDGVRIGKKWCVRIVVGNGVRFGVDGIWIGNTMLHVAVFVHLSAFFTEYYFRTFVLDINGVFGEGGGRSVGGSVRWYYMCR